MLDLKTYDNVNLKLVDGLRESIRKGDRLAIAGAAFSIYAYEALREELSGVEELRFLYTSPTFSSDKAKKLRANSSFRNSVANVRSSGRPLKSNCAMR
mgnify:CR=1 FL=1